MDILNIILLFFDFASIRDGIFKDDHSETKSFAFQFFVIIDAVKIVRIINLSKNIFKKTYKTRMDYYVEKLKMSEKLAKDLIQGTSEEDLSLGRFSRKMTINSNVRAKKTLINKH